MSAESGHPVEWAEEENYMFRLSTFREQLLDYLDGRDVIRPSLYRGHLNFLLDQDGVLSDLSVSRSSSRFGH